MVPAQSSVVAELVGVVGGEVSNDVTTGEVILPTGAHQDRRRRFFRSQHGKRQQPSYDVEAHCCCLCHCCKDRVVVVRGGERVDDVVLDGVGECGGDSVLSALVLHRPRFPPH